MKIGIMGLGNIGQKAFLPNYITMHHQVDWVLYSRDTEKLNELQNQYHFEMVESDIDTFINCGLDAVMIHTPTFTHYELIKKFLEHNIHVYVDKPISESIQEVYELLDLAKQKNLILFTGFNRRFAPMTKRLKEINNKTMILVSKHRAKTLQGPKFALFDMMIHVIDTTLEIANMPLEIAHIQGHIQNDVLHHAMITFKGNGLSAVAMMNMHSGSHTETFEVMSDSGHYRVSNLDTFETLTPGSKTIESFGDWTPTLEKRGFTQMVNAFLEAITTHTNDIVSLDSVRMSHDIVNTIYLTLKATHD